MPTLVGFMELPKWVWFVVLLLAWLAIAYFTFFGYCSGDYCAVFKYGPLLLILLSIMLCATIYAYFFGKKGNTGERE